MNSVASHYALAVIGLVVAPVIAQVSITFATIAQGSDSQIVTPRHVVVRTQNEWQTLWKEHSGEPPPTVDFSRSIVVGVFVGSRPTAGYQVDIATVKSDGGLAVVEYRERRPAPGTLVAQVLTSPFHLVSLPRDVDTIQFRNVGPPG